MLPPVPPLPPTSLWGCFVRCLKRENYARLSGRSTRREYWSFMLFSFLISTGIILFLPLAALVGVLVSGDLLCANIGIVVGGLVLLGFLLYTAMPGLAVSVRRLHDVGWSGWWLGLSFGITAVLFGIIWFQLMLGVQEWLWMNESFSWDAESMTSITAHLEMLPTYPLLDEICCVLGYVNNGLALFLFVLTLWPSQQAENRYGQKPLA